MGRIVGWTSSLLHELKSRTSLNCLIDLAIGVHTVHSLQDVNPVPDRAQTKDDPPKAMNSIFISLAKRMKIYKSSGIEDLNSFQDTETVSYWTMQVCSMCNIVPSKFAIEDCWSNCRYAIMSLTSVIVTTEPSTSLI